MNETTKVPFCGSEITVIEKDGEQFVALKPIAEALNLDWIAQYELIHRDLVLGEKVFVLRHPSNGGVQEMTCLPLKYLNGWLFKVPASRYTGKRRETIIKYQKECYMALYEFFHHGGTINPNAQGDQLLELAQKIATQAAAAVLEKVDGKVTPSKE